MDQDNENHRLLKIAVLGVDKVSKDLNVEMIRNETVDSENLKEITTADYYYEAIQLIFIDKSQMLKNGGYTNLFDRMIEALDFFRFLIYKTLTIQDLALFDSLYGDIYEISKVFVEEIGDFSQLLDENGDIEKHENNFEGFDYYYWGHHYHYDLLYHIWHLLSRICCQKNNVIKEIAERFTGTKCVAFAKSLNQSNSQIFFSLSGSSNDYVGYLDIKSKNNIWSSKPLTEAYEAVSGTLKNFYPNREIVQCHLTDDVRRYKEGKVLLARSIAFLIDEKRKSIYYSCCERKILAYLVSGGFVNEDCHKLKKGKTNNLLSGYEFLIRFEPCDKCKPALYGCNNIVCQLRPKKFRIRRIGTNFEMK